MAVMCIKENHDIFAGEEGEAAARVGTQGGNGG